VVTKRYNGDNKDLIQQIADLTKRIAALENGPQAAFTTIGREGLLINNDGTLQVVKANGSSLVLNPVGSGNPEIDLASVDHPENPFRIFGSFEAQGDGLDVVALVLRSALNSEADSSSQVDMDSTRIQGSMRDSSGLNMQGGYFLVDNSSAFIGMHDLFSPASIGVQSGGIVRVDGSSFGVFCPAGFPLDVSFGGNVKANGQDMGRGVVDVGANTSSQAGIAATATTIIQSAFTRTYQNGRAFRVRWHVPVTPSAAGEVVHTRILQGTNSTIIRPEQTIFTPGALGVQTLSDEWVFVNTSGSDKTSEFINVQILVTGGVNTIATVCSAAAPGQFIVEDIDLASNYPWATSLV